MILEIQILFINHDGMFDFFSIRSFLFIGNYGSGDQLRSHNILNIV